MTEVWRKAWLGLGGNLGDVEAAMRAALNRLDANPDITVEKVSSLYSTPPWGKTDQPGFLNACALVSTALPPRQLLAACLDAEQALKRRRGERWGPRTIDIDVLTVADAQMQEEGLSLPHPRMHERGFVLVPLAELAPDLVVNGKSVSQWLEVTDKAGIRLAKRTNDWFGEAGIS